MKKYYMNTNQGYIVENLRELVRSFFEDLLKFRVLSIRWQVIYLPE